MQTEPIEGLDGLKTVFEKTLDNREKLLRTVLPGIPLVYLIGEGFAEFYMNERVKKGIFLKSLRAKTSTDKPEHKDYKNLNKEVRLTHTELKESMVIWDDYVATFNTETNKGSLTKDKEHSKNIKSWFDNTWSKST